MKNHIAYKLIAALVCITIPAITIVAYSIIASQHEQMIEQIKQQTYQISETVKSSTKHDMLTKQRDRVHRAMETIGQQGIGRIRIYNKEGEIIFSTEKSETGQSVDKKAEACYACHAADRPLAKLNMSDRARIFTTGEARYLGVINPIYNEPDCWSAPCHAHEKEQSVLGVLDLTASLAQVDHQLNHSRRNLLLFSLMIMAAVSLLVWVLVQWMIGRPVGALVEATNVIAAGDLSHRIEIRSADELGNLARSFNTMTGKLNEVQRQVYQQDKLASLGRLAAGLAHEINNPLTGILTYSSLALGRSQPSTEAHEELSVIVRETKRCRDIVKRLLDFARQAPSTKAAIELNLAAEQALKILAKQLELNQITVLKNFSEELPEVNADATQMQQVIINLVVNAIDAMEESPIKQLSLCTEEIKTDTGRYVRLKVRDSGKGISEEDRHKIFEPFFSTKGAKGTGLGLSVVWGIIEDHQGTIEINNEPEGGTSFDVLIPVYGGAKPHVD